MREIGGELVALQRSLASFEAVLYYAARVAQLELKVGGVNVDAGDAGRCFGDLKG